MCQGSQRPLSSPVLGKPLVPGALGNAQALPGTRAGASFLPVRAPLRRRRWQLALLLSLSLLQGPAAAPRRDHASPGLPSDQGHLCGSVPLRYPAHSLRDPVVHLPGRGQRLHLNQVKHWLSPLRPHLVVSSSPTPPHPTPGTLRVPSPESASLPRTRRSSPGLCVPFLDP